jgi:hypothetical protein
MSPFIKREVRNAEGQLHCETGPARVYESGQKSFYLNGKFCTATGWINIIAGDDKKLRTILTLKYA